MLFVRRRRMAFSMKQLLMKRENGKVGEICLPDGYYMRAYQNGDGPGWCRCCIDGSLGVDEISEAFFARKMLQDKSVNPDNIYFLISPSGEIAGTVTYQYSQEEGAGTIHMVGIQKNYLGKHLSLPMTLYAVKKILDDGNKTVKLTTDDWRLPAIKTYLRAGFKPVYHQPDMKERWRRVMEQIAKNAN